MRHLSFFSALLLLLLGTISSYAQNTSTQQHKADSLFAIHEQVNGPGLAISVLTEGKLMYKNQQGYANLEHQVPITDQTTFLVGSISKQFTTFSLLLLEEKGLLSLDEDVRTYIQELAELPYTITLRQLANHTSGFRNNSDLYSMKGKTEGDMIDQEEMLALIYRQRGLNFEPGARFQYCNAGYTLLSEVVARVSGLSFAEFVRTHIFEPLGMTQSLFPEKPGTLIKHKAESYQKRGDTYAHIPMNRTIMGSTGLHTTPHDLGIWAMNYDKPRVGNKKLIEKMLKMSSLNSGAKIPYGLGQETKIYKGVKVVFHGGGDAGFRAYLLWIPEYQFSVAVAGNFESFNPLNIAYGMIDIYLSDKIKKLKDPKLPSYTTSELQNFEGEYQIFPGLYIRLIAENDSLFFQSYGTNQRLHLPILGENEFLFPHRPHSKIVFSNGSLNWHFSDFYYPGKRVSLSPPNYEEIPVADYLGTFYSEEIETSYTFTLAGGKIIGQHAFNADILLVPIAEDVFISNRSYLGRVSFVRNQQGKVVSCKISGQKAYEVFFEKK